MGMDLYDIYAISLYISHPMANWHHTRDNSVIHTIKLARLDNQLHPP